MIRWGKFDVQIITTTVVLVIFVDHEGKTAKIATLNNEFKAYKFCRTLNEALSKK
jgi:hypothetical protein